MGLALKIRERCLEAENFVLIFVCNNIFSLNLSN